MALTLEYAFGRTFLPGGEQTRCLLGLPGTAGGTHATSAVASRHCHPDKPLKTGINLTARADPNL